MSGCMMQDEWQQMTHLHGWNCRKLDGHGVRNWCISCQHCILVLFAGCKKIHHLE